MFRRTVKPFIFCKWRVKTMTLALNKELAKRAVMLLLASSKQQTDRENDFDIPQQKSILLPFVESKGWD